MEEVFVNALKVRGLGNILNPLSLTDFIVYQSRVNSSSKIDDLDTFKLQLGSQYPISEIMRLINNNLIKNLKYSSATGNITYDIVNSNNISKMSDLNGVIYNLRKETNGDVKFDTFNSSAPYLYDYDLPTLRKLITSLNYNQSTGNITFETVGEINV